jgi:hypothetical protein
MNALGAEDRDPPQDKENQTNNSDRNQTTYV